MHFLYAFFGNNVCIEEMKMSLVCVASKSGVISVLPSASHTYFWLPCCTQKIYQLYQNEMVMLLLNIITCSWWSVLQSAPGGVFLDVLLGDVFGCFGYSLLYSDEVNLITDVTVKWGPSIQPSWMLPTQSVCDSEIIV